MIAVSRSSVHVIAGKIIETVSVAIADITSIYNDPTKSPATKSSEMHSTYISAAEDIEETFETDLTGNPPFIALRAYTSALVPPPANYNTDTAYDTYIRLLNSITAFTSFSQSIADMYSDFIIFRQEE